MQLVRAGSFRMIGIEKVKPSSVAVAWLWWGDDGPTITSPSYITVWARSIGLDGDWAQLQEIGSNFILQIG